MQKSRGLDLGNLARPKEMPVSLTHLPADTSVEAVVGAIRRDGAVIVDRLASNELLDRMAAELESSFYETDFGTDEFNGLHTRRTGALIARSETARQLVQHPLVLGVTREILSHSTNFQLHITQAIAIGPDSPAQTIHRDQWAWDFFPFPDDYEVEVSAIWALTDFTEANGATRVVPGSHRAGDGKTYVEEDSVASEMERGSIVLYTGSAYHGGGANRTDDTRIGVQCSYAVGWLRQEENQYLSVPLDIAKGLTVELLRLMGYEKGSFTLGYIDNMRDPMRAVRQGEAESTVDLDTAVVALGRVFGGDAERATDGDEA
jgi:ectoine hydroxylase-related dioxygenase (phytanoyl-CoA dioxygenase family)